MHNYSQYGAKLLVGDYQIGTGQGLLFNGGCPIYTRSDIIGIFRAGNIGIIPYKGIQRIGLRGIALSIKPSHYTFMGFYSYQNLDGCVQLNNANQPYISKIDLRGKYDTTMKLEQKGSLGTQIMGYTALRSFNRQQSEIGINLLYMHYAIPIVPKLSAWNHDPFTGQQNLGSSFFYRFLYKNSLIFGEVALTIPHSSTFHPHFAFINGLITALTGYLSLAYAIYYYGQNFYSPYGLGFKYYTHEQTNEKGVYGAIKYTPKSYWQILMQYHRFYTLHPKNSLKWAGEGQLLTSRSSYIQNRKTTCTVSHHLRQIPKNQPTNKQLSAHEPPIYTHTQNKIKCALEQQWSNIWRSTFQSQYIYDPFLNNKHHGYAFSIAQKCKKQKYQCTTAIRYFNTPSSKISLYFHASSPIYQASKTQPYAGQGISTHYLISWIFFSFFRMDIKYQLTYIWPCATQASKKGCRQLKQAINLQMVSYF